MESFCIEITSKTPNNAVHDYGDHDLNSTHDELGNLLSAANQVVGEGSRKTPALFVLKKKAASA